MPAITIADLTNAKADVDHLAEIATSTGLTATDRLGNTKRTIAGAIADFPNAAAHHQAADLSAAAALESKNAAATASAAASASAASAASSGAVANALALSASSNANAASASAAFAAALVAGLSSGALGYSTRALMNADLAHPANSLALVTNDSIAANNIFYIKTGVSGSGTWSASGTSLLNSILATQALNTPALAALITNYRSTNYKYAITDENNNLALAIDDAGNLITGVNGNVSIQLALLTSLFSTSPSSRSGWKFAITDGLGNMAFGINDAGQAVIGGVDLKATALAVATLKTQISAITSAITPAGFICVGDSLTAGAGSTGGQTYPAQLGVLLGGVTVQNIGVGGQGSTSIAGRFGGNAVPLLAVTGNQIPASGAVTVTSQSFFLHNNQGPGGILGTLGGVPGTLLATAFDGNGNPTTTTFTRTTPGSVVKLTSKTPFFVDQSDGRLKKTPILWLGRNNFANSAQVLADVAACVAGLRCQDKRFVVMGVITGTLEGSGTADYTSILALNAQLQAAYPNNYVDVRGALVLASNAALPYDAACIAADTPGASLRAQYSGGSLSAALTSVATTLSFTGYTLSAGAVVRIGTEYIKVGTVAGSVASGCTRGFGGTTAAAYGSGASFSELDTDHLNNAGYGVVAQTVFNFLNVKGWAV